MCLVMTCRSKDVEDLAAEVDYRVTTMTTPRREIMVTQAQISHDFYQQVKKMLLSGNIRQTISSLFGKPRRVNGS